MYPFLQTVPPLNRLLLVRYTRCLGDEDVEAMLAYIESFGTVEEALVPTSLLSKGGHRQGRRVRSANVA